MANNVRRSEIKLKCLGRMTDSVVRMLKENNEIDPGDLEAVGFTPKEIERHWVVANALARVALPEQLYHAQQIEAGHPYPGESRDPVL
jgi:hypothetical protein